MLQGRVRSRQVNGEWQRRLLPWQGAWPCAVRGTRAEKLMRRLQVCLQLKEGGTGKEK